MATEFYSKHLRNVALAFIVDGLSSAKVLIQFRSLSYRQYCHQLREYNKAYNFSGSVSSCATCFKHSGIRRNLQSPVVNNVKDEERLKSNIYQLQPHCWGADKSSMGHTMYN
ncbi:unnamed protein product [Calypogeia fissa]